MLSEAGGGGALLKGPSLQGAKQRANASMLSSLKRGFLRLRAAGVAEASAHISAFWVVHEEGLTSGVRRGAGPGCGPPRGNTKQKQSGRCFTKRPVYSSLAGGG